jgi:hypothetical protein
MSAAGIGLDQAVAVGVEVARDRSVGAGTGAESQLDAPPTPPGQRLIHMDTFAFPDSSVGEIATRTGLPQSYVSTVVARLRDLNALETRADPDDRRSRAQNQQI